MQKQKRICCRITPRCIIGAILFGASVVNLIIVGAAYKFSTPIPIPVTTVNQPGRLETLTFIVPTATNQTVTQSATVFTQTSTATATYTPTVTSTDTPTPTFTNTPLPSPTPCTPWYSWPIYYVKPGDTLYALAPVVGSSVDELMLANCLLTPRIIAGQPLYVPKLPPTNTPTVFQNPSACVAAGTLAVVFSITPYDPEGLSSLIASYRIYSGQSQNETAMEADGDTYYGADYQSGQYPVGTISYYFVATDTLGSETKSAEYNANLESCGR